MNDFARDLNQVVPFACGPWGSCQYSYAHHIFTILTEHLTEKGLDKEPVFKMLGISVKCPEHLDQLHAKFMLEMVKHYLEGEGIEVPDSQEIVIVTLIIDSSMSLDQKQEKLSSLFEDENGEPDEDYFPFIEVVSDLAKLHPSMTLDAYFKYMRDQAWDLWEATKLMARITGYEIIGENLNIKTGVIAYLLNRDHLISNVDEAFGGFDT